MFGKRIKLARTGKGWSLRDLEAKLGRLVSAQAIGKYERDEMVPRFHVLVELAKALGVSTTHLVGQGGIELGEIELSKHKITSAKEEARIKSTTIGFLERYLQIENILQVNGHRRDKLPKRRFQIQDLADAEIAAMQMRKRWELGIHPLPTPGLAEFLEERGIKVVAVDMSAKVSGLSCHVRGKIGTALPAILINNKHGGERQRFALCRELGHLVMELDDSINEEHAGDRFAGAFLMPANAVRPQIGNHRRNISTEEILAFKKLYGISAQAIVCRLKDLGIINASVMKSLRSTFEKGKTHNNNALSLPQERSERFRRLCFRASLEQMISDSKAAELLEMNVWKLNDLWDGVSGKESRQH